MAVEGAGLALGSLALISLFNTSVQFLEYVGTSRSLGQDFELSRVKLQLLHARLCAWGDSVRVSQPGSELPALRNGWVNYREPVGKALVGIKKVFADSDTLERRYGLKRSLDSDTLGMAPSSSSVAFREIEEALKSSIDLRQRDSSLKQKFVWAVQDKKKFYDMIAEINCLVDGLEGLSSSLNISSWQESLRDLFQQVKSPESVNLLRGAVADSSVLTSPNGNPANRTMVERHAIHAQVNTGIFHYPEDDSSFQACLRKLWQTSPEITDPMEDRRRLIDKKGSRVEGTCEWIKKNETYLSWLQSSSQLLWLSGGPGKGKTMLSIYLADEMKHIVDPSDEMLLIQYFCNNEDQKQNSALNILRSLVFQLLSQRESLKSHILSLFRTREDTMFTDFEALWTCFESMVKNDSLGMVYCVIDGLDECDNSSMEVFLKRLRSLFLLRGNQEGNCRLKLIAVSREYPDFVKRELEGFPRISLGPATQDSVDEELTSDIQNFIQIRVDELARRGGYPSRIKSEVERVFLERAEGTFLWVGIAAKHLEDSASEEVVCALENLPPGLDMLYGRLFLQIPSKERDTLAQILRWVTMAIQPPTVSLLSEVINLQTELPVGMSRHQYILLQIRKCGGLLSTAESEAGPMIGLLHQSVKDYLLQESSHSTPELEFFRVRKETADLDITRRCLDCLQSPDRKPDEPAPTRLCKSLFGYATYHWTSHARRLNNCKLDVFDLSRPFYKKNSSTREMWEKHNMWSGSVPALFLFPWYGLPNQLPLIHLACDFGIHPLAENILRKSPRLNLLRNEADRRARGGFTPLHRAILAQEHTMVELLLQFKANPCAKDSDGRSSLHYVGIGGTRKMLGFLLQAGAKLEAKDHNSRTPLWHAIVWSNWHVARAMVERGADPLARNEHGDTPFHRAAQCESPDLLRLLLGKGLNLETVNNLGHTTLLSASLWGPKENVQLILQHGGHLNAENHNGLNALELAVQNQHGVELVPYLMDKGLVLKDKIFGMPWQHYVAAFGVWSNIHFFLQQGMGLERLDEGGNTPLHAAVSSESLWKSSGRIEVVRGLVQAGADVTAKNAKGQTPSDFLSRDPFYKEQERELHALLKY